MRSPEAQADRGASGEGTPTCGSCGSALAPAFYRVERAPCHSVRLLACEREAACFPTAAIALARCPACGLVQNGVFASNRIDYDPRYEATQLCSPRFQAFAETLADRLDGTLGLRGRRVVEIGCGQGDFLEMLVGRTGCQGIGIDPALRDPGERGRCMKLVRGPLEAHLTLLAGADLVICRHTLEHIHEPGAFLASIREGLATGAGSADDGRPPALFLDVPDATRIFREGAFWDVYYEHCNYFDTHSLDHALARAGFSHGHYEHTFDGQSLEALARPLETSREPPQTAALGTATAAFPIRVAAVVAHWRSRLAAAARAGEQVVLWGAGSKAVAFMSALGRPPAVTAAVDINPRRQGSWLPGSALPVIPPTALAEDPPAAVLVMNGAYREEIGVMLQDLALPSALWCLDHGP